MRPQDSEESLLSASQAKADVKGCMCPRPAPQQLHPAPASAHTVRIQGGRGGGRDRHPGRAVLGEGSEGQQGGHGAQREQGLESPWEGPGVPRA